MYKKNQNRQITLKDFNQPLGLKLDPENKWIKKAAMIPWDAIEEEYAGKDFGFYHVDIEAEKDLFNRFSLKGVPQVLFFNEGEFLGKFAGKKEEEDYTNKIDEILG